MEYREGGFEKRDQRRTKKKCLKKDLEKHRLSLVGHYEETPWGPQAIPTSRTNDLPLLRFQASEDALIEIHKFRWPISDNGNGSLSGGWRFCVAILFDKKVPKWYMPVLCYMASEEGEYIEESGRKLRLSKSQIKDIINGRFDG